MSLSLVQLMQYTIGFIAVQVMYVSIKIGLIEQLNGQAKTCQELAAELQVNEKALSCLMPWLINYDILEQDRDGKYKLTPASSRLQLSDPDSLCGSILTHVEAIYPALNKLLFTIKTGRPGFEAVFQASPYEYASQNPNIGINFNKSMEESTRDLLVPSLEKYDFSTVEKLVDIGGNTGQLTALLLQKYPNLQAILFDMEYAIEDAKNVLESAKVSERCEVIAGDFFNSIPAGGDLYMLSRILVDWDDSHALQILKNIRAAMGDTGKLLIFDMLLPSQGKAELELMVNIIELVTTRSLLRTEKEYYQLIERAGFQYPNLIKIEESQLHFIEAVPA